MAQIFNVVCSALVTINNLGDDQRPLGLTAVVHSMDAYPLRLDFTTTDMSSECGSTTNRPVYLWVVGSRSLVLFRGPNTTTATVLFRFDSLLMGSSFSTCRLSRVWNNGGRHYISAHSCPPGLTFRWCHPVYEIISSLELFKGFSVSSGSRAADVLDTVYGGLRAPSGPVGPIVGLERTSIGGRTLDLQPDQVNAFQLAAVDQPVIAKQAAFGTGKTVIAALLAARIFRSQQSTVVATTITNTAVAQFTDNCCVSMITVTWTSCATHATPRYDANVDASYSKRTSSILTDHLTEEQREREVSDITSDVIRTIEFLADVKTVIAGEVSQTPEPAMVAIATRLPQARHIYIGDIHQLEPHVRCSRSSNPARFGARGVMELLLEKGIPSAPLNTTFRCHPDLLELRTSSAITGAFAVAPNPPNGRCS
ncbi:unnamed protein product [Heligmosomoides polygyrus]|uniref:AAA_11 domain-containing protein n=1 Tax=Heligmosomoides polygyrus TaxID=6339 RepID=A0A183FVI7_HELPZ|nr:unnamed protein product [Heligmosomoides polygyrus]